MKMSRRFSGLSKETVTKSGKYFDSGEHVVEVTKCMIIESQKDAREFAVVETRVVESTAHPAHDERTWLVDMSKRSAFGNIKGFSTAVFGQLIAGTESKSFDLTPFTGAGGEVGDAFTAAIKALGSEHVEAGMVSAFADLEAFEFVCDDLFGESPPVGERLYLRTWTKDTQSGGQFTVHDWSVCDEHALGRVRATRSRDTQGIAGAL